MQVSSPELQQKVEPEERFWSLSKYWLDLIRQEEPQRAIAIAAATH